MLEGPDGLPSMSLEENANHTEYGPPGCDYFKQDYLDVKIWLVALAGSILSTISVFEVGRNLVLLYMFATRVQFRTSNLYYMMFLAFCDVFVSASYVCLMSVSVIAEYYQVLWMYLTWHWYLQPVFAISHVAMASSGFLIMVATIERFCTTATNWTRFSNFLKTHRPAIASFAMLMGAICRGTVYIELAVNWKPECKGFASVMPAQSPISTYKYYFLWKFWWRNLSTVFLPFFTLAVCNVAIVLALRRQNRENMRTMMLSMAVGKESQVDQAARLSAYGRQVNVCQLKLSAERLAAVGLPVDGEDEADSNKDEFDPDKDRKEREAAEQTKVQARAATRMLILVVICYLAANALNIVVTTWEFIAPDSIHAPQFSTFYNLAADVVNLSTVFAAAMRMPIYCLCNAAVRTELYKMVSSWNKCCTIGRRRRERERRKRSAAAAAAAAANEVSTTTAATDGKVTTVVANCNSTSYSPAQQEQLAHKTATLTTTSTSVTTNGRLCSSGGDDPRQPALPLTASHLTTRRRSTMTDDADVAPLRCAHNRSSRQLKTSYVQTELGQDEFTSLLSSSQQRLAASQCSSTYFSTPLNLSSEYQLLQPMPPPASPGGGGGCPHHPHYSYGGGGGSVYGSYQPYPSSPQMQPTYQAAYHHQHQPQLYLQQNGSLIAYNHHYQTLPHPPPPPPPPPLRQHQASPTLINITPMQPMQQQQSYGANHHQHANPNSSTSGAPPNGQAVPYFSIANMQNSTLKAPPANSRPPPPQYQPHQQQQQQQPGHRPMIVTTSTGAALSNASPMHHQQQHLQYSTPVSSCPNSNNADATLMAVWESSI